MTETKGASVGSENTSNNSISSITLFVDDLATARKFYEEVFAVQPIFEDGQSAAFRFGQTIVNLLDVEAAPELIAPARIASKEAGARMQLTIDVGDVDAACDDLKGRGVELLNGPVDRPWGVRTATFTDPSGHIWEIAAPLSTGD